MKRAAGLQFAQPIVQIAQSPNKLSGPSDLGSSRLPPCQKSLGSSPGHAPDPKPLVVHNPNAAKADSPFKPHRSDRMIGQFDCDVVLVNDGPVETLAGKVELAVELGARIVRERAAFGA